MIISDDINLKKEDINTIGITIKYQKTLKILRTVFSDNLKWNTHIQIGNSSILSQLKQRM